MKHHIFWCLSLWSLFKKKKKVLYPEIVWRQIVLYIGARNVDKFHFKTKCRGFGSKHFHGTKTKNVVIFFWPPFFWRGREIWTGLGLPRGHCSAGPPRKILGTEKMVRVDKSARKKAAIILFPRSSNISPQNSWVGRQSFPFGMGHIDFWGG